MTAVAGLPILAGDLAAAPVLTTAGLVNGLVGGYIGNTIGGKVDERRHNLTNNQFVGEIVGGAVGSANIAASNIAPKVTDYKISDFYTKGPKSNIKVNISFGDNTPFYDIPNYQGIEANYDIGLLKSLADVNGYKPA